MSDQAAAPPWPLEWPPSDQAIVPHEDRRFGPHFEKKCNNPDTIICAARSCQQVYKCMYRVPDNKKSTGET